MTQLEVRLKERQGGVSLNGLWCTGKCAFVFLTRLETLSSTARTMCIR